MLDITADIITNINTFKGLVEIENNVDAVRPRIVDRPMKSSMKAIILMAILIVIDNNIPYL